MGVLVAQHEPKFWESAIREVIGLFVKLSLWQQGLIASMATAGTIWAFVHDIPLGALGLIGGAVFLSVFLGGKAIRASRRPEPVVHRAFEWLLERGEHERQELAAGNQPGFKVLRRYAFVQLNDTTRFVTFSYRCVYTGLHTLAFGEPSGNVWVGQREFDRVPELSGDYVTYLKNGVRTGSEFTISLKLILSNDDQVKVVRDMIIKDNRIYANFGLVQLPLTAKEDASLRGLRFREHDASFDIYVSEATRETIAQIPAVAVAEIEPDRGHALARIRHLLYLKKVRGESLLNQWDHGHYRSPPPLSGPPVHQPTMQEVFAGWLKLTGDFLFEAFGTGTARQFVIQNEDDFRQSINARIDMLERLYREAETLPLQEAFKLEEWEARPNS